MSIASEWAKNMQAQRLARPSFVTTVRDADGKQNEGDREVAFVAAYDGTPRLQIRRGGSLAMQHALHFASWIEGTFGGFPAVGCPDLDVMNAQAVAAGADGIVVLVPKTTMTADEALCHAAWLVALAESQASHKFADVLRTVRNS